MMIAMEQPERLRDSQRLIRADKLDRRRRTAGQTAGGRELRAQSNRGIWNEMRLLLLPAGVFVVLLLFLLRLPLPGHGAGRVIYFNQLKENQTLQADKNATDRLGKGMLFDVGRGHCHRGYMHDHHGRCRRIV
ncbi:uncharacterized protein LOC111081292 [Drosophila obscura]|uniref:uncharacterized protein LOC111081292 n=1 Tax=Drosophila obscura TaxID=7282 RepID=UPI001BB19A9B|nr:uncharacterized protein LOC111081292 [Drosophila obscura]